MAFTKAAYKLNNGSNNHRGLGLVFSYLYIDVRENICENLRQNSVSRCAEGRVIAVKHSSF